MRSRTKAPDVAGKPKGAVTLITCPGCHEDLSTARVVGEANVLGGESVVLCGSCGCRIRLVVEESPPSSDIAVPLEVSPNAVDGGAKTLAPVESPPSCELRVLRDEEPMEAEASSQVLRDAGEDDEDAASLAVYPDERHYPTLEAMQRLHKLFGYTAVVLVFVYLLLRFVGLIASDTPNLVEELILLSQTAVVLTFTTVVVTGTLFTLAEGIKLAIDLQNNTLRMANRNGRRKRD